MAATPGDDLLKPHEKPEPEPPCSVTPEFPTYRNCEIIEYYCFKQLSFKVICYAATGSQKILAMLNFNFYLEIAWELTLR